jgi:anti-sigma-K factor RskA
MSDPADDPDLLAAEYVLGTLDVATARQVGARAESDPVLRAAITAWEERLLPLADLAAPVPPPDTLWQRLSASIGADANPAPAPALTRAWRNVVVWRCAAAAGLALAAGLAAFIVLRPPPAQPVAALVPFGTAGAAYMAQVEPGGGVRIVALRPVAVAQGKDLELWALPAGATLPIPLGVMPAGGRELASLGVPILGTQLMISLEPRGGSPTGLPTGPVLYAGTLHGV